ncbi:MAG: IS66 family transposase, partial [bacterium]
HRAVAKTCGGCGTTTEARVPGFASGRVQYGPGVKARAAWLTCAHFLPVRRARRVLNALLGFTVSDGWVAGLRAQAARLLETRFLPHVRALIAAAPVAHADETTARAAGALTYLHVACTQFLTVMHVGDRTGDTIDDDMILRFTVNLAVPFTNNTAELPARSVKVQQRTSGGSWRTLQGLINFAVVRSYLSTATKWGIDTLEAMTRLFTTGPWLPPALTPDLATPCHCSMAG